MFAFVNVGQIGQFCVRLISLGVTNMGMVFMFTQ